MASGDFKRWLYQGQRPNRLARFLNRGWAMISSRGIAPDYLVALEVVGRKSGRTTSFPLVMVVLEGRRYLVSMLGENVAWVRNVRAAGGKAVLLHGRREEVELREIAPVQRAAILKAYLQRAPGARPHIAVDKNAPLSEFESVAAALPVFQVVPATISGEKKPVPSFP